jgi:predicted dehydrogenase
MKQGAAKRQVRGLVVGLGSIGRRHARNWAALGYGPLAVCRQRNAPQPEPLGVDVTTFFDIEEAFSQHAPEVVLVTNPTSLHVETACAAVRAGAHVFIEKPLGCTLTGVRELLESARSAGKLLMVGYNLRFHPGLARLRQLTRAGSIGRILSARAEVGEYLPDWHPWEDYRDSYSARGELGGGAVLTFSHELDAMCWILGPPRRVVGMASHASSLDLSAEDVAEIVLEFDSGAIGSVHVDYVRRSPRRSLELIGETGVLRWDYERNRLEIYTAATRQWRVEEGDPTFERNQMYRAELQHFVGCVRGEVDHLLIDGEQGAAVLAIALGALRSAADGCRVDFAQHADPDVTAWLNRLRS